MAKSGEIQVCMFDSIASSLATQTILDAEIGESRRMGTAQQELGNFSLSTKWLIINYRGKETNPSL